MRYKDNDIFNTEPFEDETEEEYVSSLNLIYFIILALKYMLKIK